MLSRRSNLTLALAVAVLTVGAPGALGQSAELVAAPFSEFSGRIQFGSCNNPSAIHADGAWQTRGLACTPTMLEMSDPRLDGSVSLAVNIDEYPGGPRLYTAGFRIEGEEGAWQQAANLAFEDPDYVMSTKTIILEGEGAYEGLSAIAELSLDWDTWDLHGYVIAGEPPPAPSAAGE